MILHKLFPKRKAWIFRVLSICLGIFLVFRVQAQSEKTFENLPARDESGQSTYFNVVKGEIVTQEETWHLAFNRTSIEAKGQYSLVEVAFSEVKIIPEDIDLQKGTIKSWYEYDPSIHLVTTLANQTYLVYLEEEEQWLKFAIKSYYKNAPAVPMAEAEPGFYTFQYALSKKNSKKF